MFAHIKVFKEQHRLSGLKEDGKGDRFSVNRTALTDLLTGMLLLMGFDEEWYSETYPDVKRAISKGAVASGLEHFASHGFFEGRSYKPLNFDEERYLAEYPDLKAALVAGQFESAMDHFLQYGYSEGKRYFPRAVYDKKKASLTNV
tara:strand:- start:125 stop:562 length:438 start_codon:yes stop_codon:yes gene_type:complete